MFNKFLKSTILSLVTIVLSSLNTSCFFPPKVYDCNYTEMVYVENTTSQDLIYGVKVALTYGYPPQVFPYSNENNALYDFEDEYVVGSITCTQRNMGIAIEAHSDVKHFFNITKNDEISWGTYPYYDRPYYCLDRTHIENIYREQKVYNLRDTSSYAIKKCPYDSEFFIQPEPPINGHMTMGRSLCLVITDSLVGLMQKDYTMLERFADYYALQAKK